MNIQNWLGNTETKIEAIELGAAKRAAATLGTPEPKTGEKLPPLWHWLYFQPTAYPNEIGKDGHPATGGFLPPAKNKNRMWAGSDVTFHGELIIGCEATRKTTINKIEEKQGVSGSLLFVTVKHEIYQNKNLIISEMQSIVYRDPTPPKLDSESMPSNVGWSKNVIPDPVLLFRYSAITFNGHRIHYDYPYVTEQEGYPNLVVHGPLIATLSLQAFMEKMPDTKIKRFNFRGLRPLIAPEPFEIISNIVVPGKAELYSGNNGTTAQKAVVYFE